MRSLLTAKNHDALRYFAWLIGLGLVIGVAFAGFSLYERGVLGESRLGIGRPPILTAYYLGRLVIIAVLTALLVGGLYRLAGAGASIHRAGLSGRQHLAVYALLILTGAFVVLFA